MRHWGVLMFGDENALRWNIHLFFFFFSWLNYVCVHCQAENCCSCEGCFKRTFLPVAQNTLPPYYRDCLAHIHMQPYGNIKWRDCTPQWTCWISMSVSCSWLITWRLGWLFLTHLLCHASFLVKTLFLSYGQRVYLYTLFFYLKQWYNEMVLWIMSRWQQCLRCNLSDTMKVTFLCVWLYGHGRNQHVKLGCFFFCCFFF